MEKDREYLLAMDVDLNSAIAGRIRMTRYAWLLFCVFPLQAAYAALPGPDRRCGVDAVHSGDACVDKYETSIWTAINPQSITDLRNLAISGRATLARIQAIPGAVQVGVLADDYGPGCPDNADGCVNHFAFSVANVFPARFLTWYQALAVCRNSGKTIPSDADWTAAAFGTPDPGHGGDGATTCNTADNSGSGFSKTGMTGDCISDVGAHDMVGNVFEWVSDRVPRSIGCSSWGSFSDDYRCTAAPYSDGANTGLAAFRRGGGPDDRTNAGVFAEDASQPTTDGHFQQGVRCSRR